MMRAGIHNTPGYFLHDDLCVVVRDSTSGGYLLVNLSTQRVEASNPDLSGIYDLLITVGAKRARMDVTLEEVKKFE